SAPIKVHSWPPVTTVVSSRRSGSTGGSGWRTADCRKWLHQAIQDGSAKGGERLAGAEALLVGLNSRLLGAAVTVEREMNSLSSVSVRGNLTRDPLPKGDCGPFSEGRRAAGWC